MPTFLKTLPVLILLSLLSVACIPIDIEMHLQLTDDGTGQFVMGAGYPLADAADVGCEELELSELPPGTTVDVEIRGNELWCMIGIPVESLATLQALLLTEDEDGEPAFDVRCMAQEAGQLYLAMIMPTGSDDLFGSSEGGEADSTGADINLTFMVTTPSTVDSHNATAQVGDTLIWNTDAPPYVFLVNLAAGDVCPSNGEIIEVPEGVAADDTNSSNASMSDAGSSDADEAATSEASASVDDGADDSDAVDNDTGDTATNGSSQTPSNACSQEQEPNNSFGTANSLSLGCPLYSTLDVARDADWFTFSVDQHGEVLLTISEVAAELAADVRVWNANKSTVTSWYTPLAPGGDTEAVIDLPAPGTYFLEIVADGSDQMSLHPIRIDTVFTPSVDASEPNNSFGSAAPLKLGEPLAATILPAGDADWHYFHVDHHGELQIAITNVDEALALSVRIWDGNKSTVTSWFSPLAQGGDTLATVDLPSPGRYYLEIVADNREQRSVKPYTIETNFTQSNDEGEPNNSFGAAAPLTFGQPTQVTLLPKGDQDWYRFTVDHHGELKLAITDVADTLAVNVRAWNADKSTISSWFAPLTAGGETRAIIDLPGPGTYFLEVVGNDSSQRSVDPFTMQVTFTPAPDNHEPNNYFGQAAPLALNSSTPVNILPSGDQDWFRIDADHQGELQIAATQVPADLAISLRVWNAEKSTLSSWFNPLAAGGDTNALVDLPAPGTYFIEVVAGDNSQRNIDAFLLSTQFRAAADQGEPNNSVETATPVDLDETIPANILPAGDIDWCQIQIDEAGDLHVLVTNAAPDLTIQFRLWNSDQRSISSWVRPLSAGGDVAASFPIEEPGMYFLEVRDNGSSARAIDPYLLRFSMSPIDPADVSPALSNDATSAEPDFTVEPLTSSTISVDEYQTITVDAGDAGTITIDVPANTWPADAGNLDVGLITNFSDDLPTSLHDADLGAIVATGEVVPVGPVLHLQPSSLTFDTSLVIEVPVDTSVVAAGALGFWVLLGSTEEGVWTWEILGETDVVVDLDAGTITVQVDHFSALAPVALMADNIPGDLDQRLDATQREENADLYAQQIAELKNMISAYIGRYQQANVCFASEVSLGDPQRYRGLLDTIKVVYDRNAGDVQGKMSADGKVLTLLKPPEELSAAERENYAKTLWHELTHALEVNNWDRWTPYLFSTSYTARAERNAEYMETSLNWLNALAKLEEQARAGSLTDDQLQAKWQTIQQWSVAGSSNSFAKVPDLATLEKWTGFQVDLDAVAELYRSGQCGPALQRIFTTAADSSTTDANDSAAVGEAEPYAVFIATEKEAVLVGQRSEIENRATCGLIGWGINCEEKVSEVTSLTQVFGPFATFAEASKAYCDNLVAGSIYRPPLVSGRRGTFAGGDYWVSNAPRCD
ncbi:MAG: hypothetical protein AAF702_41365 [Chloroflexota bacterium]